jgi:TPR repeat protein
MAPSDEPKMNELKRLLRRLDGLDSHRQASGSTSDSEQRDYVGTLRGAPDQDEFAPAQSDEQRNVSAKSAALLAAVIAAIVSTATVYVLMSAETRISIPRTVEPTVAPATGTATPTGNPGDATLALIRSATARIEKGDLAGAREILRQAAELGSGPAALELARTYDPMQAAAAPPNERETNSALARAWYERARDLGMAEAPPPGQATGR